MKTPQLIISEHDPLKRWILIAALVFAVLAGGFLVYDYGHSRANFDFASLENEREEMHEQLEKLTGELEQLQQQLVASKRSSEIELHAYSEVDDSLRGLQAEILELKEEVAFYRSIVAPRESSRGLRIQRFQIIPAAENDTYRYKLVLTQVIKNNRVTRGKVDIQIEGVQNGKRKTMELADVSIEKQADIPFRFKYFQRFEGDLILPEGFVPSRVNIKVKSNRVTLDKTFGWTGTGLSSNGAVKVSAL
ncbi:DUF6776 family protein [Sulfuriflexus sp.]|uniref:DUF6776 family protein n=1 Tax=Sulfuriflexus sp. TaxID=2015443 RepID=UPI0028CC7C75|nr:DUF6776 family protein [Sulfuriflexus sp.]MDT8404121.1 hypothetical protein [Sulfuriflexus sp.]